MSPSDGDRDPLEGRVIGGKFRLVRLIGRGGMGKIYKAEQLSLGRIVALKLLSMPDKTTNLAEFRERFYREASLCARLSHPNIVTIHDFGVEEDETLWIAMEHLVGRTLMQRVKKSPLSPRESVAIVLEIARGIREAHKHGIVHRDLKCSNVMLVPDEEGGTRIKILDFGLVKSLSEGPEEESLTLAGGFLGSPGYMSPEQIRRRLPVDHRTDIYSLGVVLFRCLTGRNPFEGDEAEVLLGHLDDPPPTLKEANPDVDVPVELERLVRHMLEKQADRRLASAEEVVRTLRDLADAKGWIKHTPRIHDLTIPQLVLLDPAPTAATMGGTIGPVAVSRAMPPRRRRPYLILAPAVLLAATALVILMSARAPVPSAAPPPAEDEPPTIEHEVEPTKVDAPKIEPVEPAKVEPAKVEPVKTARRVKAAPAVAIAPEPPPSIAEKGFLSLDTRPWSNVSEAGHALGSTPLIRLELPEGPHTLTLTTESGLVRRFIVQIKAGQVTGKRLGLE
jgi:serine/threonine protein kinase